MSEIAAVAIGRNEGGRLRRCLRSLAGQVDRIVYVDSGSTDDSVAFARSIGATVVELDRTTPFTAARARNFGFAALRGAGANDADLPEFVQFVDGDCQIDPGWVADGRAFLDSHPDHAIVTGWRTEIAQDVSIYHAMAEIEWHQPPGEILSCGGDMLVRTKAFVEVGGFVDAIICSEDEEFVLRLRKAGWYAHRLARITTHHDIAMTRFSQWWRRTTRSGHGFAEVGDLHPPHFRAERRRVLVYGLALPICAVAGAFLGAWWLVLGVLGPYGASWLWTARGLMQRGSAPKIAVPVAALFTLSKFPALVGYLRYRLRVLQGGARHITEYK